MTTTYPLEIDLEPTLDDAFDDILCEARNALENIRRHDRARFRHTEEVDVHALLAEHQAIALVWDAEQLLSHYPHLSKGQAWEVLQECERNYKGEEGLAWDDIAEAVTEMFPDPEERQAERVGRFFRAVEHYRCGDWPAADNLVELLADARHWCDAKELDFSQINGKAYEHYLDERNGGEEARP